MSKTSGLVDFESKGFMVPLRVLLLLIPKHAYAHVIETKLFSWWSAVPCGAMPKFDLMWFKFLGRYAKMK